MDAAEDLEAEVIVITGAGRAFTAGGDLEYMQKLRDEPALMHRTVREAKRIVFSLLDCDKPVICKVNGDAIGLGTTLALFCGTAAIEKFLVASVGYLYLVYFVFVAWCVLAFGDRIAANLAAAPVGEGWFTAGVTYAGYNVATIPAVLFCVRHFGARRDALAAGALAGPLGMLPGVAFYIAMVGYYAEIGDQALPSAFLLGKLQAPWFEWAFQLAVMLTLVDTGVALLHAINERVANAWDERGRAMPRALRPALAVGVMLAAVYAATAVGLVDLVAKGYGTLTWYFLAIYVLPLMTWGVWLLLRRRGAGQAASIPNP